MQIETIRANELTEELVEAWRRIQQSDETLSNPFLCPEFTQAAGETFRGTFVGILMESGKPVGFLPFERFWGGARGVRNGRADYEGVIAAPGVEWTPEQLLRGCGVRFLEFSHLPASQKPFEPYHRQIHPSHVIDLSGGVEAYQAAHNNRELRRLARKAEEAFGPVRLVADIQDDAVLTELLEMKRQQCARMGWVDFLADAGQRQMIERLPAIRTPKFAGILSALYFGDTLAAALVSIRSASVMHAVLCAYNESLAHYSPGSLFYQRLVNASTALGVSKIDLGHGDEPYKLRLANRQTPLASAIVGDSSWASSLRRYRQAVKQRVGGTWAEAAARAIYRGVARCVGPLAGRRPIGEAN